MKVLSATLTQQPKKPSSLNVWTRYMRLFHNCHVSSDREPQIVKPIMYKYNPNGSIERTSY